MIKRLCERLLTRTTKRKPDFVIGDDYLRRWWVIPRNPFFNIYLHNIRRSDDDRALHDHPWPSLSYMIRGRMLEFSSPAGKAGRVVIGGKKLHPRLIREGQWVYRPARFAHRLAVINGMDVWTLFITGPRIREWGFHCPQGWRHWKEFTAPGDATQVGKGCE